MASLIKIAKTGAYRIKFYTGGEDTETVISLGRIPKKTAELIHSRIESILECKFAGQSLPVEVASWTANISDELQKKLVKAGLIVGVERRTLGVFIRQYIEERADWKRGTRESFLVAMNKHVLPYFGADAPLRAVTAEQADLFRSHLVKAGYSEAYIGKTIERIKNVFNVARRRKLIDESPFDIVKTGSHVNTKRQYFVSVEEVQALIDACNNASQRLIIALARWGGLRVPLN